MTRIGALGAELKIDARGQGTKITGTVPLAGSSS
jgi:hypothetical protein